MRRNPASSRAAAADAATRRISANTVSAIDVSPPFRMEVELREPLKGDAIDDAREHRPELSIVDERTIAFEHEEMSVAYRMAAAVQFLAMRGKLDWY